MIPGDGGGAGVQMGHQAAAVCEGYTRQDLVCQCCAVPAGSTQPLTDGYKALPVEPCLGSQAAELITAFVLLIKSTSW